MKRGTCATCTFYIDFKNECRYNPPQVVYDSKIDDYKSIWPTVDNDDYCHGWYDARVKGKRLLFPQMVDHVLNKQKGDTLLKARSEDGCWEETV